jgi:hypothetical protein
MKRIGKMFMVTCVAMLAFAAVATAGASAHTPAQFTASATGELTGTQTTNQVFTVSEFSLEKVTCKKAHTHGTIVSVAATSQEVTVTYSECTADFAGLTGLATTVTPATYDLFANGEVTVKNTITISVPSLGCKTTVGPQVGLKSVSYTSASGKITESSAVKGIKSTGEGLCPGGTTGTYTGSNIVERVGGGTLAYDATIP